jgi:hypothetical protein
MDEKPLEIAPLKHRIKLGLIVRSARVIREHSYTRAMFLPGPEFYCENREGSP